MAFTDLLPPGGVVADLPATSRKQALHAPFMIEQELNARIVERQEMGVCASPNDPMHMSKSFNTLLDKVMRQVSASGGTRTPAPPLGEGYKDIAKGGTVRDESKTITIATARHTSGTGTSLSATVTPSMGWCCAQFATPPITISSTTRSRISRRRPRSGRPRSRAKPTTRAVRRLPTVAGTRAGMTRWLFI